MGQVFALRFLVLALSNWGGRGWGRGSGRLLIFVKERAIITPALLQLLLYLLSGLIVGKTQRQIDGEGGAHVDCGLDLDVTAHNVDHIFDDRHTKASALY